MYIKIWNYRFQTIPTLFTIPTFILLMSLGCWQLERLAEKEARISELKEKAKLPSVQLPKYFENISSFRYRKVNVSGEYMHDKEMFLYSGSRNNRSDGFMIFTPLKTTDNRIILINRGWIPTELKSQAERLDTLEPGIVEVIGYIMLGEDKSWIIPENNDKKNIWFNIDLPDMQKFVGTNIENYYIMRAYNGEDYPIGNDLNLKLRNNHLEYAITWFTAAFSLITIFFLYHKRHDTKLVGRK